MHPNAQPLEEAQHQLSLMLQQQEELAPALYRDLALYLQVLREGLLPAVQQACFHLATQVVPERYGQLPEQRRLQFQQRLASLVQRCSALLTVEQLMGLAAQQLQREHRRHRRQREQLLQAFLEGRDPEAESAAGATPAADHPSGAAEQAPLRTIAPPDGPAAGPQGSVHLGMDLPLSADLFDRGIPGLPRASGSRPAPAPGDSVESAAPAADAGSPSEDAGEQAERRDPSSKSSESSESSALDRDAAGPGATVPRPGASAPSDGESSDGGTGEADDPSASAASGAGDADLRLLQSLFQLAAEGLGQELQLPSEPAGSGRSPGVSSQGPADEPQADSGLMAALDAVSSSEGAADSGRMALSVAARIEPVPPPDPAITASSLPRDPLRQVAWWRQFDRALSRRLRNLSHALNVELMRLGLAQGLLPLNLLDAVLEGQVEPLPAPANLLRLPLPLPLPQGGNSPTEVLALLLRPSDLEYEQPRLRTCRKRLEQRRRALRTMAKRYRIWQRRVTALEAEQQWFRDSAQLQNRPQPPSPS